MTGNEAGGDAWLPIGVGVHTGTVYGVVCPRRGSVDVTAMGEAMNIAARLADAAEAGHAYVSQSTLDRSRTIVSLTEQKQVTLKGIREPVSVGVCRLWSRSGALRVRDGLPRKPAHHEVRC